MINLTPHTIRIRTTLGAEIEFPPSGMVARVACNQAVTGFFDLTGEEGNGAHGDMYVVPITERKFNEVEGLPEDTSCPVLVSALVLSAVPGRPNTFAPDTGASAVRDEHGQIVAVTKLIQA